MLIDGIKAFPMEASEARIWRFRYDQGAHRNLCVVNAKASDQELIRSTIRYALFGLREPTLKGGIVHLTDSNGEAWIFDRQGEQFRCFRNRQIFDGRLDVCLKEIFKDYISPQAAETAVLSSCLREFDISYDGQALYALPQLRGQARSTAWERAGAARLSESHRRLGDALGLRKPLARSQLEQLLPFGENLHLRLHTNQQQQREIEKTFAQLSRIDVQLASRLEQELALIDRMRTVAEPLLDPAKSPRLLQERLSEIETELEEICSKWQIQKIPSSEPEIDWGHALQALTRYLACDKLEKAARKSIHDARTLIKPVYDGYRQSVGRFLQSDRALIQELETCLNELGEHIRQAVFEQERQKDNIAGKLNKLLGLNQLDGDRARGESCLGPHSLELSRAAVNQCLQAVGRLYSELEQNQTEHDGKFQELEQRYERILAEYGKAREQWQVVSKQLGLAMDIGVRGFVTWMNQHGKLAILHQRRLKLQEDIQDYRSHLKTLAQLLEDWRLHTGSQKSSKLDNSAVILAEARGVLQYADKKRTQLEKLRALSSQFEAYQQIKSKVESDLKLIQDRWLEAMSHWGLPAKSLDAETWDKVAKAGREVLLLEALQHESSKPLKNEQIFSSEALDTPLTFYLWKDPQQGNKARILLLQQVELADDAGLGLIFTEDGALAEMLSKLGLGRALLLEAKPEAAHQSAVKPQKTLVSEKARAALEVFATKQGGTREL